MSKKEEIAVRFEARILGVVIKLEKESPSKALYLNNLKRERTFLLDSLKRGNN